MSRRAARFLMALSLLAGSAVAAEEKPGEVTVRLKDGNEVVGRIVSEDDQTVELATASGASVTLPRATIVSMRPTGGGVPDPNDSRLVFGPSGRPMRKGEGSFSDYYILFPGVSFGLTDNVTLMGGISAVPGIGLDEQLYFGAVKLGKRFSDTRAASVGYFYAKAGVEEVENGAGIGFAVLTLGRPERSLSAGFGLAHGGEDVQPIIMGAGEVRVSRRVFLIGESWVFPNADLGLNEQPFALAFRFCGDRLSVDAGAVLVAELIEEGFPIPWLSFSYNFGAAGGGGGRGSRAPLPMLPSRRF